MDLYVILRRNGFASAEDLEAAAARSTAEGDKDGSGVRWIRSYVVAEESGELGTFCIYEAESPEAIRAHARRRRPAGRRDRPGRRHRRRAARPGRGRRLEDRQRARDRGRAHAVTGPRAGSSASSPP